MVREGSTYYWDRRLSHLSAASIIPLLGLAVGYEYARAMAIIGTVVLVGGEATRLLIPSVNAWFIEWLGMLLKPGEEHKVTAATYLVVTSLVMLLVFDLEIAALALLFLAFGDPLAGLVGKRFGRLRWDRWFKKELASTSGKSAEGALAFLVGSLSIATLLWTKDVYLTLWPPLWSSSQYRWKTTQRFLSPVAWSCGCCGSVNRHNQPHTEALNVQDYTR
jgi:dolichol kinase